MAISSYSTTPASNTSISGINIAEGCPPSGINDAIRQMMADIATDVPVLATVQSGKYNWVAAGGTADAITATYSPAITTLVDGQECCFRATASNATTTPTFSPNGLTPRVITKTGGVALSAGDILNECILRYNLANTRWELLNPYINAPFFDTTPLVKGSSDGTKQLRFEVDGFTTGTTRVLTPPNFNGTIATLDGGETFNNKLLVDSSCTFVDNGDTTKKLAFQCSGITTGTTRTVTVPDASGTMLLSQAYVYFTVSAGVVTVQKSSNVTSVTRNGAGDYTVTMTNAAPDSNFVALITGKCSNNGVSVFQEYNDGTSRSATTFRFYTDFSIRGAANFGSTDVTACSVFII
jgi:hypothetical protein